MNLPRTLEPEVMDSLEEAVQYDAMDHSAVNHAFVEDLLAMDQVSGEVLDLGTGTAQIPILLCRQAVDCCVLAIDLSETMLDVARNNIELAGLSPRIQLDRVGAGKLPYHEGRFAVVISNSIVHHLPEPAVAIVEARRVVRPGGRLFFRDLMRPDTEQDVQRLIDMYVQNETPVARKMFEDSLRAALTLEEISALVADFGFAADSVQATSDRHWTWATTA